MTDRAVLAQMIYAAILTAREEDGAEPRHYLEVIARVLAEHETTCEAERVRALLQGTVKGYQAGENAPSKLWRERAEAAEARCAHLESGVAFQRDRADKLAWLADKRDTELSALKAEHERLRAALRDLIDAIPEPTLDDDPPLRSWVALAETALAPSQEPVK